MLQHLCHFSVWRGEVTRKPTPASRDTLEISGVSRVGLSRRVFGNMSHDGKREPVVLVQSRPYQVPQVGGTDQKGETVGPAFKELVTALTHL